MESNTWVLVGGGTNTLVEGLPFVRRVIEAREKLGLDEKTPGTTRRLGKGVTVAGGATKVRVEDWPSVVNGIAVRCVGRVIGAAEDERDPRTGRVSGGAVWEEAIGIRREEETRRRIHAGMGKDVEEDWATTSLLKVMNVGVAVTVMT